MELNFNELRELVTTLSQTDISELTLKSADFELTLRKQGAMTVLAASEAGAGVAAPMALQSSEGAMSAAAPVPPAPASPSTPPPSADKNLLEIASPMVGTFYRSPAPDEAPFVNVGDRVQIGQTVCIIEAMKLMNELDAEVAGEVVEILVENAQTVEFGQVLMRVRA